MKKVADYSWARPGGKALKGYDGVMRYLSYTPGKNLSLEELKDLQKNDISVGLVWESTAKLPLGGFNQGISDAKEALKQSKALGFPATLPIYFACDFDSTPEQQIPIDEYFRGVNTVLDKKRVGVYGSYYVMIRCKASGYVTWFWQTLAWSGGQKASFIHLYQNGKSDFSGGVDVNEVMKDDYGQWDISSEIDPGEAETSQNTSDTDTVVETSQESVSEASSVPDTSSTSTSVAEGKTEGSTWTSGCDLCQKESKNSIYDFIISIINYLKDLFRSK